MLIPGPHQRPPRGARDRAGREELGLLLKGPMARQPRGFRQEARAVSVGTDGRGPPPSSQGGSGAGLRTGRWTGPGKRTPGSQAASDWDRAAPCAPGNLQPGQLSPCGGRRPVGSEEGAWPGKKRGGRGRLGRPRARLEAHVCALDLESATPPAYPSLQEQCPRAHMGPGCCF